MAAQGSQLTRSRVRDAWLYLTPMLVVLAAVAGYPLLMTIFYGFTDAKLDHGVRLGLRVGRVRTTTFVLDRLWRR